MSNTPDPLDTMQTAMQNDDKANLRLFLALDYAVSLGLMPPCPTTDVLNALDYARSCAADLFRYLTAPAMQEAGPTEDQQATVEAAHNAEPVHATSGLDMGGFIRTPDFPE